MKRNVPCFDGKAPFKEIFFFFFITLELRVE